MKKLLLCLSLLLIVTLVIAACGDKSGETETEAGSVETTQEITTPSEPDESASDVSTEAPTEAPTVPPEWLTYDETEKIFEIPTEAPTEAITEAPGDPTKPVTVLGTDKLTSTQGIYNLDNGIADNGDYVTIVPTGEDPYYYPAYNFSGGRYIIVKYRTSNCDGIYMQVYLSSSGTGPSDDSTMLQEKLVGDGNWNYLVIDTKALMDKGKYDGMTVAYLRFDPLDPGYALDENGEKYKDESGSWVRATMPEGATLDVAYIAFCHAPDTMQNLEAES